jgi:hypothetical protein
MLPGLQDRFTLVCEQLRSILALPIQNVMRGIVITVSIIIVRGLYTDFLILISGLIKTKLDRNTH